ncbi:MAG TPA: glucose 1-dehydrogenase [Vineibacter sp.]|nr:glucose 1-dehydrogenase [Vineibacter sp.]
MQAITVLPGVADSLRLENLQQPPGHGDLLVEAVALGVCGTDLEIIAGHYGQAPPGREQLVLGHESLGRVLRAPGSSGFDAGDMVVGIVRHPDPQPCPDCAIGEWDMCGNGFYTEHGIKALDGFGAEQFFLPSAMAVKVDPALGLAAVLLEPASIVAKAWEHVDRIGHRALAWQPRSVLVTGAGPIGLLAALMASQRGLDVHVVDRNTTGLKPSLVRQLGATPYDGMSALGALAPDIVIECTGAGAVALDVMRRIAPGGIVCLTGVGVDNPAIGVDFGHLNRSLVLGNIVVFGSVNANRRHYQAAAAALDRADRGWLDRVISRRVPQARWREAFERRRDDVKVIIEFGK